MTRSRRALLTTVGRARGSGHNLAATLSRSVPPLLLAILGPTEPLIQNCGKDLRGGAVSQGTPSKSRERMFAQGAAVVLIRQKSRSMHPPKICKRGN